MPRAAGSIDPRQPVSQVEEAPPFASRGGQDIAVGASYPRRQLFADNESNCAALAEF
jgi:hypothetical protein